MEVREQGVDDPEHVPRPDEERCFSRLHGEASGCGGSFERPDRRGPHGYDATALRAGTLDAVRGPGRDRKPLREHAVPREVAVANRQERSRAHVQRERDVIDAPLCELCQEAVREVQSRGRRRDRAGHPGEHRLVPLEVLDARPGGPPDVRWERQLSDPIEPPEHVAGYAEPEPPPAVSERREPLAFAVREAHALTDPGRSAHESLPRLAVLRTLDEEDLELASRRSAPAHPRTDDTRVV